MKLFIDHKLTFVDKTDRQTDRQSEPIAEPLLELRTRMVKMHKTLQQVCYGHTSLPV